MPKVATGNFLKRLRSLFTSVHSPSELHAYIVLSNDCHMSEYTSVYDQRRKFISGFGGSAGSAVITLHEALIWTDGRYFLEAEACLDENWKLMKQGLSDVPSLLDWICDLSDVVNVGTDPSFISYADWITYKKKLEKHGKTLIPVKENLVDIVWNENQKHSEVLTNPYPYSLEYAGITWEEKVKCILEEMKKRKADVLVLSSLDEIAWLLNLRGHDIECCPVFKAFCLITSKDIYFFIDEKRLADDVKKHLNLDSIGDYLTITVMPYSSVVLTLKELSKTAHSVWIDKSTPAFIALEVSKGKLLIEVNPVTIFKSIKNNIEIQNLKKASIKDAACLCEFFGYLERNIKTKSIDEIEAADYLLGIRSKMPNFVMNSFPTISSVGPNAGIIHYRPSPETTRRIDDQQIYLCDSGAQYFDGTTDITRTLHFGSPSDYEKECYTLVLKGHIALASSVFPKDCRGSRLDSFARQYLWGCGLDYLHGTGHGIGQYLNVHEGPQRISPVSGDYELKVGNVLSNEPGYYEDGKFGIRIENMMTVIPHETKYNFKNIGLLSFESVSFIPMHMLLIDVSMLTSQEICWLNDYHKKCLELIKPELESLDFQNGLEYLLKNAQQISV